MKLLNLMKKIRLKFTKSISLFSFLLPVLFALEEPTNKVILTPDYGILKNTDIYVNTDWDSSLHKPYSPIYWQCKPTNQITLKTRYWHSDEPNEGYMCDFQFVITHDSEIQTFSSRRAHPRDFCDNLKKDWHHLTKNEPYTCISSSHGSFEETKIPYKKSTDWVWEKVITKKGCQSYLTWCADKMTERFQSKD